jgi:hypothetical protein
VTRDGVPPQAVDRRDSHVEFKLSQLVTFRPFRGKSILNGSLGAPIAAPLLIHNLLSIYVNIVLIFTYKSG